LAQRRRHTLPASAGEESDSHEPSGATSEPLSEGSGREKPWRQPRVSQSLSHSKTRRTQPAYARTPTSEEFTFQPKISEVSRRIVEESAMYSRDQPIFEKLSDTTQSDARRKQLKQQYDQAESLECTFNPRVNSAGRARVEAMIDDYGEYLEMRKLETERQRMERELKRLEAEERELKECTFQPKIIKTPGRIKDIVLALQQAE